MKKTTREEAEVIVRKDRRNEPPDIPGHEEQYPTPRKYQSPYTKLYEGEKPKTITEAVERFIEVPGHGIWFTNLCEQGPRAIEAQAWQVAESLCCDETEALYAMKELAHELLPETPAGQENPKDEILKRALEHLSSRNVPYVPLAIEEDIQASYENDTLEEFRETVRTWIKALAQAKSKAA